MKELRKSFWDFITILGSAFLSIPLMIFSESVQARYLGPSKYGQVALLISVIALFFRFGLSWLKFSIMRFGKEEFLQSGNLRRTTANFVLISSFSFVVIISLFYLFKSKVFDFLEIEKEYYFWIICAGIVLLLIKNFIFEVLKVIRMIKLQTLLMHFAAKMFVVLGLLVFVFGLLHINLLYVIIVFLFSDFLVVVIGFALIRKDLIFPLNWDRKLLKRMLIFSFPLLFASWSNYIITWIDTYVIKYFLTLEDVGIYQASYKILNTFRSFILTAITTVSTPIILVFKTNKQVHKISDFYLKRLIPQFSFFAMLLIGLLLVFSDIVFKLIYGAEFDASVLPFKIIITTLHLGIISASFTAIRISFDMTKLYLYLGILAASLNIILDVIFVPILGILGAAGATFLVFSINPVIWYVIIHRKFKIKRKLALFFPLISFIMLLINIFVSNFGIRFISMGFLFIIAFFISRRYNLFHESDVKLLDQVKIPNFAKRIYIYLIDLANR